MDQRKRRPRPTWTFTLVFYSPTSRLAVTVFYQLQHSCWDVPDHEQIRRRVIQGLVGAVGVVSVLLWYPLVIESESLRELRYVITIVNLKAVVISYLHCKWILFAGGRECLLSIFSWHFLQPSAKLTLLKGSEGGCLKKALFHIIWIFGSPLVHLFVCPLQGRVSFGEDSLGGWSWKSEIIYGQLKMLHYPGQCWRLGVRGRDSRGKPRNKLLFWESWSLKVKDTLRWQCCLNWPGR